MKIDNSDIEVLVHAAVRIRDGNKAIYIDPFELSDGPDLAKADLILITHDHYDHCSPKDIGKITTPTTTIVTVADCQSKLSGLKIKNVILVEPGREVNAEGYHIKVVPAYNIGKQFHPKQNDWVGYIIEVNGKKLYHSGDTDLIPEMKDIDVDIAFLPVGGTYTMNAKEAAQATRTFKRCKLAIPMHYGAIVGSASDAEEFKQKAACEVRILM